jgi:hypothetical protein
MRKWIRRIWVTAGIGSIGWLFWMLRRMASIRRSYSRHKPLRSVTRVPASVDSNGTAERARASMSARGYGVARPCGGSYLIGLQQNAIT